ncbi:cytidine deaminase [Azospirillum sp.]|uniref:cytidine deaminase n=1 Tax=Azospirillum sp. TaxID=34012 RepID=UPI003D734F4B
MDPALAELARRNSFRGVIAADEVQHLGLALPDLLPLAARYARPPVSGFSVGAVAQGLSGAVYLGANIEFPGQPLNASVHAEQSAVANAWMHGERGLSLLAVTAAPCGHCRQFLHELAHPPTLLLPGREPSPLSTFLPDAFGPHDLGIAGGLMDPADHRLTIDSDDPLLRAALEAANASHAPYTRAYAGAALRTADGAVVTGRYAENAAFNPGLPPLQCAVALLVLSGRSLDEVTAAALVEHPAPASHAEPARALLAPLGIPVTVALARPLQS